MSKYRARKTTVDGITFASMGEARRYQELKLMERAGLIANLERQTHFRLEVLGEHVCDYRADFRYVDLATNTFVVEDFKGYRTAEYRLKRKLMKACHGIDIYETGNVAKPRRRRASAKQEAA